MTPTITYEDVQARLARMEELTHRGRSQETQALVDWIQAELTDLKVRIEALESA